MLELWPIKEVAPEELYFLKEIDCMLQLIKKLNVLFIFISINLDFF
jgi:hypothetical protein